MSYCTPDDVRVLTSQVTGKDMSDAEIQKFIDTADAIINAHLYRQFTVPFSTTPPLIKSISERLSAGNCLRKLYTGQAKNTTQNSKDWLNQATEDLEDLDSGIKELLDNSGVHISRKEETVDNAVRVMPAIDEAYPDYLSVSA